MTNHLLFFFTSSTSCIYLCFLGLGLQNHSQDNIRDQPCFTGQGALVRSHQPVKDNASNELPPYMPEDINVVKSFDE